MAVHVSVKRLQIDKANTQIVIAVGVAAFALTFALIASRSLIMKQSYQNKVKNEREKALTQLEANIAAVDELKSKYSEFVSRQENVIKGSSNGKGERDGDNARIILDALPSKYDFPALMSSMEKILDGNNYEITNLSGTDNEASQNGTDPAAAAASGATAATVTTPAIPQTVAVGNSVEMPFEVGASGDYKNIIGLLGLFRYSIRPMKINSVTLAAGDGTNVDVSITGVSYFQPERTLNITEEVVQ